MKTITGQSFKDYIWDSIQAGNWGGMQTVRFLETLDSVKYYSQKQCREFLRHIIFMDNPGEIYTDKQLNEMLNPLF